MADHATLVELPPIPFSEDVTFRDMTYPLEEQSCPEGWTTHSDSLRAVLGPGNPLHLQPSSIELCRAVAGTCQSSNEERQAAIEPHSSWIAATLKHVRMPLCNMSANLCLQLVVGLMMMSSNVSDNADPLVGLTVYPHLLNLEMILAVVIACPQLAANIGKLLCQFRLKPWTKPIEMFPFCFSGETLAQAVWNYLRYVHVAMHDVIVSHILGRDPLTFSFVEASVETRALYRAVYLRQDDALLHLSPSTRFAASLLMEFHYRKDPRTLAHVPIQAMCFYCGTATRAKTAWHPTYEPKHRILKACSACGFARYCDRFCQKMHWPEHKLSCNMSHKHV